MTRSPVGNEGAAGGSALAHSAFPRCFYLIHLVSRRRDKMEAGQQQKHSRGTIEPDEGGGALMKAALWRSRCRRYLDV